MLTMKKNKHLYVVVSISAWRDSPPFVCMTKKELVAHLSLKDTRKVDRWFRNSWVYLGVTNTLVAKLPILKVKSKIRA